MKKILLMVTLLFACGYLANVSAEGAKKQGFRRDNHNVTFNQHVNQHVLKYIPTLTGTSETGFNCTEEGASSDSLHYPGIGCTEHKSADNSIWLTRAATAYSGSIDHIFKVVNGKPVLWAQFEPNSKQVVFLSEGARTYASARGNNDEIQTASSEQTKTPNISLNQCAQLSGTARRLCEGAGKTIPAFGGLFK